ncbi:MAG TPA: chemotaxis protein CheA [Bryobacteraceae bacterium]|nr:chemotaxis protein CheA [Bryobacteraceae bacterium]
MGIELENLVQNEPARLTGLAADPELLAEFIAESREYLNTVESQTLTLEQDPRNTDSVHAIFRGFHTIKGLAGFLELKPLEELAHEIETVLDLARNANLAVTSAVIDRILESKDFLVSWITALQRSLDTGAPPSGPNPQSLIAGIRALVTAPAAESTAGLQELSSAVQEAAPPPAMSPAPEPAADSGARPAEETRKDTSIVRINTTKLDHLVDMVGELVITQSLVRHDPELGMQNKPRLSRNIMQLARITDDVQRTAMSMRMVPVAQLFQKMSRLVRDLSKKTGKPVEIALSGENTELDRNIVEQLADPLMHMLRNALDHGIENSAERAAAGKNPTASISLKAGHEAGHIVVEVGDDGRGLDREKILAKGIGRGLVAPGAQLLDAEVYDLIFQPGFSTAEQVTAVSGRGVGMDVVRKNVQKLRGRVDIHSVPGKGTTFFVRVPLTLAIIDALLAGVGVERYVIPIYTVREMLRPTPDMISTVQGRAEMALIRGSLLPIIRLHRKFHVQPRSEDPCESLLIVSESGGRRFCLMVDELIGKQEVVIKSLGEKFQHVQGVAGAAILGDGRIGLILDPERIFGIEAHV